MFDKLEDLVVRFNEILEELNDPTVVNDQEKFRKLMKEQNDLSDIVEKYKEYKQTKENIEDSLTILDEESDEELKELAKEELSESKERLVQIEEELKILLLPKDPNDDKNVIVEIRGGAGGDEAALFAADLYRMYTMFAERNRWKIDMMNMNENGIGGFKEVVFMINGTGAYSKLKYESGVHRVQRIPTTESGGRIHTSTATVAIMPEAEEVDVQLDMNDCKFDVFRASGNGGQCVNTTDSAVRLTHIPTGIVISCQDEKSQLKNRDKALKVLRSRLYELEMQKAQDAEAEARISQVGTGDRSEKIRTYNFPQGRVTDHRIKFTSHRLEEILNGDTVKYVNYQDIESYLEYDFKEEKDFDYSKLNKDELIKHIAKFTSSIWQVHPFGEGNTRTTAVFTEKYLNNMGFNVNNDMFKNKSLYFRNALVRSNYGNIPKGIYPKFDYLVMFFENLLQGKNNELKNRELYIKELFENND